MQKKLTRKEKIALQQQGAPTPSAKRQPTAPVASSSVKRTLALFIGLFAFLLYANTLNHHFVLDDHGLMPENSMTKKGIAGLGEIFSSGYRAGMSNADYQTYRPLSKAMFAIEWQISPENPSLGHWMNVIWFTISCVLLFHVLSVYMKGKLLVPFLATLIFIAHPLHTEVVANIKSRDEIMNLLFCMLTALLNYRYVTTQKIIYLLTAGVTFFLALLTKESAITWLAVFPLLFYFFTDAPRAKYLTTTGVFLFFSLLFLLIRRKVLGNYDTPVPIIDNSLLAIDNPLLQRANAFVIMGVYLKLLVFPHPLCIDGSYNTFPPVGFGDWHVLLPFAILAGLAVYALLRIKKKDIISFSILYFLVTVSIVSNIFVMIGTNYGERLLYIPSLGFCIALAVILQRLFNVTEPEGKSLSLSSLLSASTKPVAITALIVVLFSVKTVARSAMWKDEDILFTEDLKIVPNSAHMQFYQGNHITAESELETLDSLQKEKQIAEGIGNLSRAIEIFPQYAEAYQRRGYIYYTQHNYPLAEVDFKKALEYNPSHAVAHNNYGNLLFNQRKYSEALEHFQTAAKYNPLYAHAINNMASVYGVYGEGAREQAQKDPANAEQHLKDARAQFEMAIGYFLKAIEIDPTYPDPYNLVSITYRNIGDEANADRYALLSRKVLKEKQDKKDKKIRENADH